MTTTPIAPTADPRADAKYWHGVLAKAAPLSATDAEAAKWADIARARLREAVIGIREQTQTLNETERRAAIDPGWLAALGIGFSQAGTFGFGDEAAGLLEGVGAALVPGGRGFSEAYREATGAERATRAAARGVRPGAYWTGEVLGTLPALIGAPGTRVGAGGALFTKAPAVANTTARALARIGIGGAKGAALAGTEAAGRADTANLGERLESAATAAPFGAAVGGAIPYAPTAARIAANRLVVRPARAAGRAVQEFLEAVAGKAPRSPRLPRINATLLPEGIPSVRPVRAPPADALDLPTFLRSGATVPETPGVLPPTILSPAARRSRVPIIEGGVNTGTADAYLRAGNISQLERFDPVEVAKRAGAIRGIGPKQMERIVRWLEQKLGR